MKNRTRPTHGLTSSLPGKIGLPCRSSAKIQPTDHISTAGPYFVVPRSNSGGLFNSKITNNQMTDKRWTL